MKDNNDRIENYLLINAVRLVIYITMLVLAVLMRQTAAIGAIAAGLVLAAVWLLLEVKDIIIITQNPRLIILPIILDIFLITLFVYFTGAIHSILLIGYFLAILISSQNIRMNSGTFASLLAFLLFLGMNILILLGVLPEMNLFDRLGGGRVRITIISLILNGMAFWIINKVGRTHINQIKDLVKTLEKSETDLKRKNSMVNLLLRDFDNQASDWLWELDGDGRFTYVSERIREFFHNQIPEAVSLTDILRISGSDEEGIELSKHLRDALDSGKAFKNLELKLNNGPETAWLSLSALPLEENGEFKGWRGVGKIITSEKALHDQLIRQAYFDEVTGLPNRYRFNEMIDRKIRESGEGAKSILGIIKLGNLDRIRTDLGTVKSYTALNHTIKLIYERIGWNIIISQLQGWDLGIWIDEPDLYILDKLHRLSKEMNNPLWVDPDYFHIDFTMGIAFFPEDANDRKGLLRSADLALNSAGSLLTHRIVRYKKDIGDRIQFRLDLMKRFPAALENHLFEVFYQPQIDSGTGKATGAEALIRWRDGESGNISPGDFIPVCEQSGFIITLGEWIMEKSIRDASQWPLPATVSVNVSGRQLEDSGRLLRCIKKQLEQYRLPPERLIVEITESAVVENYNGVANFISQLNTWGIRIALDDFGTGYSSLSYIQNLSLDKLKIDQSFVREIGKNDKSEKIINAIVSMARSLSLSTVAEGIETEEQAAFLRNLGCDWFQGYLYGKPMVLNDFRYFLQK
ncbi:MAG: EAL domain-containing protein [Spirochaetales bacterium]|nr:EAL domain-containing protein [Spirochaetales bacterium]